MSEPVLPLEGACRCGEVRFRISAPPLLTGACHCTGCQRMTGSAFSLSATVPSEGFEVVQGETVGGGLSAAAGHRFCPRCKSWMFTRSQEMDWFVNVRPTLLEDAAWFAPFMETYTSEKLPWASTPAVRSYERFPPAEAYEELMETYRAWAQS